MTNKTKKSPENIEIVQVGSDRIIFEHLPVEAVKKSEILDPNTGMPFEDKEHHYDRHPGRGIVVAYGSGIFDKIESLEVGDKIFIEDPRACTPILINGKKYLMTRSSNIILVYKE